MGFLQIFTGGLLPVFILMTMLWIVSVRLKDASIVDPFWSIGFVVLAIYYFWYAGGNEDRKLVVLTLVSVWGIRLFSHLFIRFLRSSEEDHRYRNFRNHYGPERYWWVSYFQVFMLQGILLWIISMPLLASMHFKPDKPVGIVDVLAAVAWLTGFIFEAGSDYQLVRFRSDPANRGKLLTTGFWRYTRHPNYFGDSMVWWGFGIFAVAAGAWWALAGTLLMMFLLLKVSGVAMLERSLKNKQGYEEYMRRTSAFFPWIRLRRGVRHQDPDGPVS